jgi:hypothetical protein
MKRTIALAAVLLTTACQVEQTPGNTHNTANEAALAPSGEAPRSNDVAASPTPPTPAPAPPGEPGPTPSSEASPDAAVAVLQAYCDAIAHKNYAGAFRMWVGKGEATGMSEAAFAQSFAKYDAYDCSFGKPGDAEGAAGSSFITVPAVVTGTLAKGGGFSLRGPMTLKRVNDVPGSSAEQRHWHISTSGLKPRP